MICLLVITNGRDDCLDRTIDATRNLDGPITECRIWDDTGDPDHAAMLRRAYPAFTVHQHPDGPQGFGGAIRGAWQVLATQSMTPFVFHLEDDFVIREPVDLQAMADVLTWRREVAQMALLRQPWNEAERAAGGIFETWDPGDAVQQSTLGHWWIEHRRYFTTNPSLYRRALLHEHNGWPIGPDSEGRFGIGLAHAGRTFGYWGSLGDAPRVEHIGTERVGTGY